MMSDLPNNVERELDEMAPVVAQEEVAPIYTIDPLSKIPVSRKYGAMWQGRIKAAEQARKDRRESWDEAIRYYNHNQSTHRSDGDGERAANRYFSKRRNTQWSETENIVFANTQAIMPMLYAKNPQVEFTDYGEEHQEYINQLEGIVNTIASMTTTPGINLKLHAERAVLAAEVCNLGWLEYGYTEKQRSSDEARDQLMVLAQELQEADDVAKIKEIEGKLMAVEESLDVLTPAGPWVRYRPPHDWLFDSDSQMPGYIHDSKWGACKDYYPTEYLNARYGRRDADGKIMSIYAPTHVLMAADSGSAMQEEINNFKLFDTNVEAKHYGYETQDQLNRAKRTECWRIWDKTTRRVFLYAVNKWDMPIWAENDPYGLPWFYPVRGVYFNISILGPDARSNVTYYLDQQDALNEIHDEARRGRQSIREALLYNAKVDKDTITKWLTGSGDAAVGVSLPDGMRMQDVFFEKPNAFLRAQALFDPGRIMSTVDRVSGVTELMRGAQLKTNTTKFAVQQYDSSTSTRLDAKIDKIEDAIGDVLHGIAFLCAQFMDVDTVASLIGRDRATNWINRTPDELRTMFSVQAVGGSTQKPTSSTKKQVALSLAELLAKFLQFAPKTVLKTTFDLLDNAFDELDLPQGWASSIQQEAEAGMQRGNSAPGGQGGAPNADPGAVGMEQLANAVDALPPQAKIALGNALAQGVPVVEALPEVMRAVQSRPTPV